MTRLAKARILPMSLRTLPDTSMTYTKSISPVQPPGAIGGDGGDGGSDGGGGEAGGLGADGGGIRVMVVLHVSCAACNAHAANRLDLVRVCQAGRHEHAPSLPTCAHLA